MPFSYNFGKNHSLTFGIKTHVDTAEVMFSTLQNQIKDSEGEFIERRDGLPPCCDLTYVIYDLFSAHPVILFSHVCPFVPPCRFLPI